MSVEKIDNVKKEKSRHQSTFEYFEILQLEWFVADLRAKIYPKIKDKEFWKKTREGKKITIQDIAIRNNLPSIFDDDQLEHVLRKKIYRDESYPNFIYRNHDHKLNQEYYDLLYYFNPGSEVRFEMYGEMKVGKVKEYKPFEKNVTVVLDGREEKLPILKVTRIL